MEGEVHLHCHGCGGEMHRFYPDDAAPNDQHFKCAHCDDEYKYTACTNCGGPRYDPAPDGGPPAEKHLLCPVCDVKTKRCSKCGEEKPLSAFSTTKSSRDGKYSYCKPCDSLRQRWRYEDKHEMQWERVLWSKYRIHLADYYRMYAEQHGRCAICREHLNASYVTDSFGRGSNARRTTLHIDHDHATRRVRALLCHDCNMLVGWIEKQRPHLTHAIRYVRKEIDQCRTAS